MQSLSGAVALVTGGSRGIGEGIAKRLAREGAKVVFTYASSADRAAQVIDDIRTDGGIAHAVRADNDSVDDVNHAIDTVAAQFGHLDILVNNAGLLVLKPFDELSLDEFDRSISINVRASFIACKAAISHMRPGGRIINIGSTLAERVPGKGQVLYAMAKTALVGMTKALARDLGPRGITVNIVHPGATDTDMNPADGENAAWQRSMMAIPDFAKPADIAGIVAWLASPESGFMTGAALTIDGGSTI